MKQLLPIIAVAGIMLLGGCKEKKTTQDIIAVTQEAPTIQAPISMQEYKQSMQVEWQGSRYQVTIVRTPADSLPKVKDEVGQEYVDNQILLTVSRPDSTVFFQRLFTKTSFSAYLDDDYRRTGILEAMIFEEVDDGKLEFAVSVAHPQSEDEFIPLEMKLDRNQGIVIKRDDHIDTSGWDDDDDDDDDDD